MKNSILPALFFSVCFLCLSCSSNPKKEQRKTDPEKSDSGQEVKQEEKKEVSKKKDTSSCADYIETSTDKMTGKQSTYGNRVTVSGDGGKTGLSLFLLNGINGALILSIQAVGAGNCIDKGDKINILFKDGSKLELYSDGKFNCDGNATVYFGGVFGKKTVLNQLKEKKINTMRVWTNNSYVEEDFSEDNGNDFYHTINCLTK